MNEAYRNALVQARNDLAVKVEEVKVSSIMTEILELHQTLNGLESLLKEPKTSLGSLFNLTPGEGETSNRARVRFDEFAGLSALDAAKKYLKKCQEARPFKEIMESIIEGGGKVESEDQLKMSLSRSTLDVVKINERYGLLDDYPSIKAQRASKAKKQSRSDQGPSGNLSDSPSKEADEFA